MTKLNLAQKLVVSATLLTVAVFLLAGGVRRWGTRPYIYYDRWGNRSTQEQSVEYTDWGRTTADAVGIMRVGGVVTFLLGLIPKRKAMTTEDAPRLPPGK